MFLKCSLTVIFYIAFSFLAISAEKNDAVESDDDDHLGELDIDDYITCIQSYTGKVTIEKYLEEIAFILSPTLPEDEIISEEDQLSELDYALEDYVKHLKIRSRNIKYLQGASEVLLECLDDSDYENPEFADIIKYFVKSLRKKITQNQSSARNRNNQKKKKSKGTKNAPEQQRNNLKSQNSSDLTGLSKSDRVSNQNIKKDNAGALGSKQFPQSENESPENLQIRGPTNDNSANPSSGPLALSTSDLDSNEKINKDITEKDTNDDTSANKQQYMSSENPETGTLESGSNSDNNFDILGSSQPNDDSNVNKMNVNEKDNGNAINEINSSYIQEPSEYLQERKPMNDHLGIIQSENNADAEILEKDEVEDHRSIPVDFSSNSDSPYQASSEPIYSPVDLDRRTFSSISLKQILESSSLFKIFDLKISAERIASIFYKHIYETAEFLGISNPAHVAWKVAKVIQSTFDFTSPISYANSVVNTLEKYLTQTSFLTPDNAEELANGFVRSLTQSVVSVAPNNSPSFYVNGLIKATHHFLVQRLFLEINDKRSLTSLFLNELKESNGFPSFSERPIDAKVNGSISLLLWDIAPEIFSPDKGLYSTTATNRIRKLAENISINVTQPYSTGINLVSLAKEFFRIAAEIHTDNPGLNANGLWLGTLLETISALLEVILGATNIIVNVSGLSGTNIELAEVFSKEIS